MVQRRDCDHHFTEPREDGCRAVEEPQYPDGTEANDVFIIEGAPERYGSQAACLV